MTEKFQGTRTPENEARLAQKQAELKTQAEKEAKQEASEEAENIVRTIASRWSERGFTPEQCVWSLALATINFRESIPESFGGKAMFDRVAYEAKQYYDENKGR